MAVWLALSVVVLAVAGLGMRHALARARAEVAQHREDPAVAGVAGVHNGVSAALGAVI